MSFAIVTDSLAGLPLAQIAQRGLVVIPLSYAWRPRAMTAPPFFRR